MTAGEGRVSARDSDVCPECDLDIDIEQPDPCVGRLIPGVSMLCCGHGGKRRNMTRGGVNYRFIAGAYVRFDDGGGLVGEDAVAWIRDLSPDGSTS